jgi:hypothetical protein
MLSVSLSTLLALSAAAQLPVHPPLGAPQDVLDAFGIRDGSLQELLLPQSGRARFEVRATLDGQACTLALEPFSLLSPDFQLLVKDWSGIHLAPTPPLTTYRGIVVELPGSTVSASLQNGRLEAHVYAPGSAWTIQSLTDVMPAAPRSLHVVYRHADILATGATCGVAHQGSPTSGAAPEAMQYCEIALDCDHQFYLRNGSDVNRAAATAVAILTNVSLIYQNDVEIRYLLTSIVVHTMPTYTTGDNVGCNGPGRLHEFQAVWLQNFGHIHRDTAHHLSGAGTFTGAVGCSEQGTICVVFTAFGVSRVVSTNAALNVALVAHELGHNWNATHCNGRPECNIMCANISGCSGITNAFGVTSRAEILAHKATRTCLSELAITQPNPNVWYRLTTQAQGENVALDVIPDGNNNRMHMVPAGNYTGQAWRFTPFEGYPGYFRISCLWQGPNRPMDVINVGPEDNHVILNGIAAVSGQAWLLAEIPEYPGTVSLTTIYRGQNMALAGNAGTTGNRPVLMQFRPHVGQAWRLIPLNSMDPAAATSFGTACRGRGGVPQLQLTNGSLPWLGESVTGAMTSVPAGAAPVLILGTLLSPPLDLGVIGSPGCFLRVSPISSRAMPASGNQGTFTLALPRQISLAGVLLPIQGAVVDPAHGSGNPLIATSNGLELRFGLR